MGLGSIIVGVLILLIVVLKFDIDCIKFFMDIIIVDGI